MSRPPNERADELARELREAYAALRQEAPEALEKKLTERIHDLLAGETPEAAAALLEALAHRFPLITHERDEENRQNQKQLKQLQLEIAGLRSRLDDKLKKDEWSLEIGAELAVGVLQLIYGVAANLDYDLRDRPDNFTARLCDSVRILLMFTHDLSGRLSSFLEEVGGWKEDSDMFEIIKERLMSKTDPGPGPLESYLEEIRRKLPILLAAHHKATIGGARKILKDLSPGQMEVKSEGARLKGKWNCYEETHEQISSYRDYQLYKQYFEEIFKTTIKEEDA